MIEVVSKIDKQQRFDNEGDSARDPEESPTKYNVLYPGVPLSQVRPALSRRQPDAREQSTHSVQPDHVY